MVGKACPELVIYGYMGVDEKALGQRLQKARQRAGLTQQELCQKAGLSYSTLAKIERGAIKAPSVFTVAAIAGVTNSTVEKLLDIKSPPPAGDLKKTSKSGVKVVYFDLNDTLVRAYEKAFTTLAEISGLPLDSVEAFFWRHNNDICSGNMTMADFNAAMGAKLAIADFDWARYYLDTVEPVPGMDRLVEWTAEHYRIGILSNTMPELISGLQEKGKLPFVKWDYIIDSSEVKCLKTDPKIYEIAQNRASVAPGELLLVDNDRVALINADELGWQISAFNTYAPEESISRVRQHLDF